MSKSTTEKIRELYAARPFDVHVQVGVGPNASDVTLKSRFASKGKSVQEFLLFMAEDQPHLKTTPLWADGGRPAVRVQRRGNEEVRWEMPVHIPDSKLIPLLVKQSRLEEEIKMVLPGASNGLDSAVAQAVHLAERYMEEEPQGGMPEFLFHLAYERAKERL